MIKILLILLSTWYLAWDANPPADSVLSYQVYKAIDDGTFVYIDSTTNIIWYDTVSIDGHYYYYLTATNKYGTSENSITVDTLLSTTWLPPPEDKQMKIYPNPCDGQLTIDFGKYVKTKIDIYNIIGEIVSRQNFEGVKALVFLNYLPNGIYIYKTIEGNGKIILRR